LQWKQEPNMIDDRSRHEQTGHEPSDPVERAEQRKRSQENGDVSVGRDGTVRQKPHGNMDETLIPQGKDHPEQGPYTPGHDHVDPDVEPASESGRPGARDPSTTPEAEARSSGAGKKSAVGDDSAADVSDEVDDELDQTGNVANRSDGKTGTYTSAEPNQK
jgi:hypothetical protein